MATAHRRSAHRPSPLAAARRAVTPTCAWSIGAALVGLVAAAPAGGQAAPADGPYVVEYYYKARWGYQQEFLDLFRRNHLPLLLGRVRRGTMSAVTAAAPRYHATEDGRWDYRVTITFPNVAAAHVPDPQEAEDRRRLYPDSARFAREEQRRFEILEAHWDVPLVPVPLAPTPARP